ncbi:MAG: LCP family protein [Clostridia bacterium]|nr:LCP family protein [Clostridia bacterium]
MPGTKREPNIFNEQDFGGHGETAPPRGSSKRGLKVFIIFLSSILTVLIALTAVFLAMFDKYYDMLDIVPHVTLEAPATTNGQSDDVPAHEDEIYNILLIGTDARKANETGRSDTMILVTINPSTKRIVVTSFMRDTYVGIPGHGSNRLNAAYSFGGATLLKQTLKNYYDVDIDWHVKVDFTSFIQIIDSVGGVTINVTERELSFLNKNVRDLNLELGFTPVDDGVLADYGLQNLNGKQALGYARIRKADSEFARTSRQREVLEQLFIKAKAAGVTKLLDIANQILPLITTDISKPDLLSMMSKLPAFLEYDFVQARIPIDGTWQYQTVNNMDVIVVDFEVNREALQDFMFGYAVMDENSGA